jgi:hypothetical protein
MVYSFNTRLGLPIVTTLLVVLLVSSSATGAATWNQVNASGFGSVRNWEARSMSVFGSFLYVGAGNASTGCQVWRSSDGNTWSQVNVSGFGSLSNWGATAMSVLGSYLYVCTQNGTGCQVWRSSDGTTWNQVNTSGFGEAKNIAVNSLSVLGSYLYAGTANFLTGCQVWRSSDGTTWNKVNVDGFGSVDNIGVFSTSVFGSHIYVGTSNSSTGCQVWRSSDGTTWNQVNDNGFGTWTNSTVSSMSVLGSYLYAFTYNSTTGCQVWRSPDGTTWNQVTTGGFGNAENYQVSSLSELGSYLYAGTRNYTGCQVWRSSDGTTWSQVNTSGFGSEKTEDALCMSVLGSRLYVGTLVGTSNDSTGCQVWSTDGSPAPGNASSFYFAEGYTGPNFAEYLCMGNPNNATAIANVTYMFSDGTTKDAVYSVPANCRYTVSVNSEAGADREVSIRVLSETANLVAERPMYFNYQGQWTGGSDALGAAAPGRRWYFAEGTTLPGFDEYVTVLNPGDNTASLTFKYMVEGQGEKDAQGSVGAHSRATFKTRDQIGSNLNASLSLEATQDVVAERPMYFKLPGSRQQQLDRGPRRGRRHFTGGLLVPG